MRQRKKLKKALALIVCAVMMLYSFGAQATAPGVVHTGVRVRDPYVLAHNGSFYLYGTFLPWGKDSYGCAYSTDLQNWSDPVEVYTPQGSCDGVGDWWAPECHYYRGSFYLFATYRSAATGKRGVGVFRAADPLGPFEIISDGHITPKDRDAIDGTLYVDEDGQPWMIYVGEWTSAPDGIGSMMAAKLSENLTTFVSEPILLFRAKDAPWAGGKANDGPFLYKTKTGRLLMLWSNNDKGGYCVGIAYSSNGRVDGAWQQQETPLYSAAENQPDGGHGMLFTAPDGTLMMAIHSPNISTEANRTTAILVPVVDIGDTLVTKDKVAPPQEPETEPSTEPPAAPSGNHGSTTLWQRIVDWFRHIFSVVAGWFGR